MIPTSTKLLLNTIDLNTMDRNRMDLNISEHCLSLEIEGLITQPANKTLKVVGLAALLFISGCVSNVDELPEEAQIKVPDSWQPKANNVTTLESDKTNELSTNSIEEKPVVSGWLNSLNDDALNIHVEKALINNPDLLSSAAQLKNAFEQVTITGSSLWPQLSFDGDASTSRSSEATEGEKETTKIRSIGGTLNIQWEADIWRKLSQRRKAAALDAKAQGELYKAAELSLVANVSRAWYNLATNKLQLDLAQKRLDSFQNTANLIEENYERGLRSALDVYLSRTDVQLQISALADSKFNYIQAGS